MALIAYAAGLGRDKGQQGGIIMDGQQVPRLHNGCGPAQPLELAFFFLSQTIAPLLMASLILPLASPVRRASSSQAVGGSPGPTVIPRVNFSMPL